MTSNAVSSRRLVNTPVKSWTVRANGWMTTPDRNLTGVNRTHTVPGILGGNTTPPKKFMKFRWQTFSGI